MVTEGYQLVEPRELPRFLTTPENRRLWILVLSWAVHKINEERGSERVNASIEVVRVEYLGVYAAIGIRYSTTEDADIGPLVLRRADALISQVTVLELGAFLAQSPVNWDAEIQRFW
jgi:hypothetical protein